MCKYLEITLQVPKISTRVQVPHHCVIKGNYPKESSITVRKQEAAGPCELVTCVFEDGIDSVIYQANDFGELLLFDSSHPHNDSILLKKIRIHEGKITSMIQLGKNLFTSSLDQKIKVWSLPHFKQCFYCQARNFSKPKKDLKSFSPLHSGLFAMMQGAFEYCWNQKKLATRKKTLSLVDGYKVQPLKKLLILVLEIAVDELKSLFPNDPDDILSSEWLHLKSYLAKLNRNSVPNNSADSCQWMKENGLQTIYQK
ncbi:hypothetical protein HELRODRAFT_164198 [Helobdella robusta]|uniref:Uncharacterized protein n=1 Tax=Helobdella robusta TaxID=6412 RepID=T1EV32_HELRO|nr:hypothetical protein HELRODRAFT_164198 [Helobdella robusta]ESN94367.1 hypothetical protein HELRODRAFT_164198 [Helobdella robusta]